MQDIPLHQALGAMVNINQFFVWRLTWDSTQGKYQKQPCADPSVPYPMDASLPQNWLSYTRAAELANAWGDHPFMNAAGTAYAIGFWMTEGCGYWFLDIDKSVSNGAYSQLATEWCGMLPGVFFELSSSGNGVHLIGRGTVPQHSKRNKALAAELYTEQRGIAFGLSGRAWGSADVGHPAIASIASLHFAPKAESEVGGYLEPRADWKGPTDDAELVRRARASKSMAARFGNKASFEDLWTAAPEAMAKFYGDDGLTERDMALASHLAFWTGCDAPRMERLMRQSGLARAKWDEHRTYLRELTIANACAGCKDVLNDVRKVDAAMYAMPALPALAPLGALPVVQLAVTPEHKALIDGLLDMVHRSPDWDHVHNFVIPAIREACVPPALMPRLENAVNKRLDLWDAKLSVAKLRALLSPARSRAAVDGGDVEASEGVPEWAKRYVYVRQGDAFHDTQDGVTMSRTSFSATHNRDMPIKGDGPFREDAVQWALDRWNVPMVHDTMYYPGKEAIISYDGKQWANIYNERSHPEITQGFTVDGTAAINRFMLHLWHLCGQRERVWQNLISFMAHNVKYPGKKIRWVPIIKGVEGDGKTLLGQVLDAAMGGANVASIGPEIVANTGGFTDWAHGNAFVALEEMYMAGRDRYRIANAIKQYISNNKVSINPKGGKPKKVPNTCNQAAFTNHSDAVPIESDKDRRWFVIFTPFSSRDQLHAALGLKDEVDAEVNHFDVIFDSLAREPGQWRKWLMDWEFPDWFSADRAAMHTDEKVKMALSGIDDVEAIARSIIEDGCHGVSSRVLSSACLTSAMKQRAFMEGVELPKTSTLHHLLTRMGFAKVEKLVKWANAPHRVWIKPGEADGADNVRMLLDMTKTG